MSKVETQQARYSYGSARPFTSFTRAGDFLWLSGQTAHDLTTGELAGDGDLNKQVRAVFQNIKMVLEEAGCGLSSIVKLTTYFSVPLNEEVAHQYWAIRHEFLGDTPPASTGIQVAGLITPEVLVEIDVVAYAPQSPLKVD